MNIAFIDHSYHQKTKSSEFFRTLLEDAGHSVEVHWCDAWRGGASVDLPKIAQYSYDRFIFWQQIYPPEELECLGPDKVIMVPMIDGCANRRHSWWKSYRKYRFISFSRALDQKLRANGIEHIGVQYWPEPESLSPNGQTTRDGRLSALFWMRSSEVSWQHVRILAESFPLGKMHIHQSLISDSEPDSVHGNDVVNLTYKTEISEWSPIRDDYQTALHQSHVYFAPRLLEGIGMSFLEAMALGLCVVAPNSPTMNEYIIHDVSGFLYDIRHPLLRQISAQEARNAGLTAREMVIDGRVRWRRDAERIEAFIEGEISDTISVWRGSPELPFRRRFAEDLISMSIALVKRVRAAVRNCHRASHANR